MIFLQIDYSSNAESFKLRSKLRKVKESFMKYVHVTYIDLRY